MFMMLMVSIAFSAEYAYVVESSNGTYSAEKRLVPSVEELSQFTKTVRLDTNITFQVAYDTADALQQSLDSPVALMVGIVDSNIVGHLEIGAEGWNSNVYVIGCGRSCSSVGNIRTQGSDVRLTAYNVTFGDINTTTNENNVPSGKVIVSGDCTVANIYTYGEAGPLAGHGDVTINNHCIAGNIQTLQRGKAVTVGGNVVVGNYCTVGWILTCNDDGEDSSVPGAVTVGNYSTVGNIYTGTNVLISAAGNVTIGKNCVIGNINAYSYNSTDGNVTVGSGSSVGTITLKTKVPVTNTFGVINNQAYFNGKVNGS